MNLLKISLRRNLLRALFIGFAVSLTLISHFILENPSQNSKSLLANTALLYEKEKNDFGLPMRLKIPKIAVDSSFEYVGLTSLGAMDVPKNPNNVAWFSLGSRPGEVGSAVVAGHSGWKDGESVVFDDLYKLDIGDKLYVENERGMIITFVVRRIRTYDPLTDSSSVFSSGDGKTHLNLITCVGTWDKISRTSSSRLVVFTDKESE